MFADSGLSDEIAEKIVAFVDREAGRDAPLTAADEAMVRRLIADDPAARRLADELRATNAGLDTLLDDVAAVEVPERLVALIRGHGADGVAVMTPASALGDEPEDQDAPDEGEVVALRAPVPRRISYGPLAAAASVALLISSGALYYIYDNATAERSRLQAVLATAKEQIENRGRELADVRAELRRLAGLAEQASSQREETTERLLANEEVVQQLEVERAALEGRYAALEGENQRLSERLERQRAEIVDGEAARDRISSDLADARQALSETEANAAEQQETLTADVQELTSRIAGLTGELEQREQTVAALTEQLEMGEERSSSAAATLAGLREQQADLERRLAAAELDKEQLQAERQQAEQAADDAESRLASLQADMQDANRRLATVVAGLTAAEEGRQEALRNVVGLEADLAASQSWLGQIAQYHRVYASTARRHLVEVGANELDHIRDWLTRMLGRPIEAPDLTAYGVTFAGARLLAINDRPVAQLVYLDPDDQPLALCVIPSTGGAKDPTRSVNGELNLVDWRDGRHAYAVVGWSDPELLATLTQAIQPVYDL